MDASSTSDAPSNMDSSSSSDATSSPRFREIHEPLVLRGNTSQIQLKCAWSPSAPILASTSYLWTLSNGAPPVRDLSRVALEYDFSHTAYLTALDWNVRGTLFATDHNGIIRIWKDNGELKTTLRDDRHSTSALKWSKDGRYILAGGRNGITLLWNVKTQVLSQLGGHIGGMISDVDWRNGESFLTCSDNYIQFYKIRKPEPVKTFEGHQEPIQSIKWDPTGSLIASCSLDETVKIWSLRKNVCVHNFSEHEEVVYAIGWSPTGPCTEKPNQPSILASGSGDSTVKFWDADQGVLRSSLIGDYPIMDLAFSPNGEYIATQGLDQIQIWSVREQQRVRSYENSTIEIGCISWNKESDMLAIGYVDGTIHVINLRM